MALVEGKTEISQISTYSSEEEKWEDENGLEEGEIADDLSPAKIVRWQTTFYSLFTALTTRKNTI